MKIAIATHRFVQPLLGGVDVYTERLRRSLEKLGHEITIIAFDPGRETNSTDLDVSIDVDEGTPIWRIGFSFSERPKEYFDSSYDPEMGDSVRAILEQLDVDILIIMNFYTITLSVVEAAKSLGMIVVHVATDFLPVCRRGTYIRWNGASCKPGETISSCSACFVSENKLGWLAAGLLGKLPEQHLVNVAQNGASHRAYHPLKLLEPYWRQVNIMESRLKTIRPLRAAIDVVLVPTRYTGEVFVDNGFQPSRVHLMPFGVEEDNPLSNLVHEPADHIRFLFIGRLQPYKGLHLLLKAFRELKAPRDATLTIYGVPEGHNSYYSDLRRTADISDRVEFKGRVDQSELAKAFANADIFVLPSIWHENSPLILLDALQSRTPVIASDIGGVQGVVQDKVNGMLFPMGDVAALREAMQYVIDRPDVIESLRARSELPSIDDYAETLVSLYRERMARTAALGQEITFS